MFVRKVYYLLSYYLTLFLFGACGLALNLASILAAGWPATDRTERFFQRLIHRHFAFFMGWLRFTGLARVHFHGFDRLAPGGQVLAANHPGLMDITYLLARVPEAVCIFKPAIRANPVLGGAARRAGYLANDGGHDLVRQVAAKIAAGHILIIFPEGTRTPPGTALLPLKPGFVLMARRAGVPIQLVRITWSANILAKGQTWWKLQDFPSEVHVTTGPRLHVDPADDAAAVTARIEAWFRSPAHSPTEL
jgi:1-acyl-sn-glycerol-3-phosphate acyltransferase